MFCRQCGNELSTQARFCRHCGTSVRSSGAAVSGGVAVNSEPTVMNGFREVSKEAEVFSPGASERAPLAAASATIDQASVSREYVASTQAGFPGTGELKGREPQDPASQPPQVTVEASGTGPSRWWLLAAVLFLVAFGGAYYFYRHYILPPTDSEIVQSIQGKFAVDPNLSSCSGTLNAKAIIDNAAHPVQALGTLLANAVSPCMLDVKSQDRVVTLTGVVSSQAAKDVAARIAGQQRGVKQVDVYRVAVVDPRTDPSVWMDELRKLVLGVAWLPGSARPDLAPKPVTEAPASSAPVAGESVSSADRGLDPERWQKTTPLLARFAAAHQSQLVAPQLTFDQLGMKMAGVNGTYQFTGVQSRLSFLPPFTVRATVMGTVANGNAFVFSIARYDFREFLKIEGNLNPQNGSYHGMWLSLGNAPGVNLVGNAGVNQWYTLVFSTDSRGNGTVTVADGHGAVLATKTGLPLSVAPFFVILGQREGAPFTVGPNEAIWSSVEVTPRSGPTLKLGFATVSSETSVSPGSAPSPAASPNDTPSVRGGIRGVDFLNFDYQSNCLNGQIHVSKGEQEDNGITSFKVVKTIYGDVLGDGSETAAVHTMAPEGNSACNEVFVFAASSSGPRLLARLTPSDWGKGEEDNGGDFQVSDVYIINRQLAVSFYAGGSHACPAWTVTSRFQWKGGRFVRVGLDRKPFKCR